MNARRQKVAKTHQWQVESSRMTRAAKRTRQECQRTTRTIGTCRRSCAIHQNTSTKAQNEEVENTHHVDLEGSQTSRAPKRLYQATSTTSRNVLGQSATSTLMKRTHHVEIKGAEAIWASWRGREASKAIGTAKPMSKTSDMIRNKGRWMAQRAAHAATRNESPRDR